MPKGKATRKFEKKHLKGVVERRKETAKLKQRAQVKDKKQARKAKDAEFFHGPDGETPATKAKPTDRQLNIANMSVDEFFKGGFEMMDDKAAKPKLGKRKRTEVDTKAEAEKQEQLVFDDDEEGDGSDSDAFSGFSGESGEEQKVASDSESDNDEVDLGMSKQAMDDLAKNDPDFYQYLKENDPETLDFDVDEDLAEVDDLSVGDSDNDGPPQKKQKKNKKKSKAEDNELSQEQVAKWRTQLEGQHSLRAGRQVVLAFRCASYMNDIEDENSQPRYVINNPDVFHDVLVLALKQIPIMLQHHLPLKEHASGKITVEAEGKKLEALSGLLKTYTASVLNLLSTLSDDATLRATISALDPILPYLLSYRKLLKNLIKSTVSFWCRPASSDSTRITAFLVLRKLVVIGDAGIRESILKAVYQGLLQGCRTTNANTIKTINLMKNSAAEIFGIEDQIGYTVAFSSIRQLAIHLRNSITPSKKKDAFRQVYNWQYVHALDFWSCVLAEHCTSLRETEVGRESLLRPLIYPLTQVTIGAMRLIPSSLYFPLRFHLIRSLLRVSRATDTFIPIAPFLIEVLESSEMKNSARATTKVQPVDFALAYKSHKAHIKTRVYQDGTGDQVVELLSEFFYLWCTNIAFPELALPVLIMVKRWLKQSRKKSKGNKNKKVDSTLVILVQKLEATVKFIEEKRATVEFAPRNRGEVDAFLKDFERGKTPVGAFVEAQRELRDVRKRDQDKAREEEIRRKAKIEKEKGKEVEYKFDEVEDEEDDEDEDVDEQLGEGVDWDDVGEDEFPGDWDKEY